MNLRTLARKPLVHFMLAGAVLFGLQTLSGGRAPAAPAAVVVTAAHVEALAADWRQATGRHPSEDELERAIEDWVDRELLFRAALDQGLQRSDALVQRRLIQNQRFLEDRDSLRVPYRIGVRPSHDPLHDRHVLGREHGRR